MLVKFRRIKLAYLKFLSHVPPVFKTKPLWVYIALAVLAITICSAGYFYIQYRQLNQSQADDAKELAQVVKQVGQLMDLPEEETPVLATVTDKEKVKTQTFFARSENGDKVLIYTKFGRAILYRPSANKIVDVTLINATETTSPPTNTFANPIVSPTTVVTTKVILLNGTTTTGLAGTSERKLLPAVANLEIIKKANANQQNYTSTQVIPITANATQKATEIASFYKVSVLPQLPEGETTSDADVVVILGKDAQ